MRRLGEELRATGRMLAMNPAMVFVAIFVVGLGVSTAVRSCPLSDKVMSGSLHVSGALRLSPTNAIWRGARMDHAFLRTLAYPRPPRKSKAPEKSATPRSNPAGASTPAPTRCAGLSDLRFPEFNLLIPPL